MGKKIFWTGFSRKKRMNRNPGYKCGDIKVLVPATTPGCFAIKEIIPISSNKAHTKQKRIKLPKLKLIDNEREGERYNAWRRAVLSRDQYQCVLCDSKERIEAHHIVRWVDNEKLRYHQNNGVALCYDCHQKYHNYTKQSFPIKITNILNKYIEVKYAKARLVKVPRETRTDYNTYWPVNSRTNKNVPG